MCQRYVNVIKDIYDEALTSIKSCRAVKIFNHNRFTLSICPFVSIMKILTKDISCNMLWYMLLINDIILISEISVKISDTLEMCRTCVE